MTCSLLISYVIYKETALFFGRFFWLSSMRNTTSHLQISLLPCGAPEDKGDGLCGSPSPLSSGLHLIHPGMSAAAGLMQAAAVYTNLGIWYQVQVAYPQFRMLCNYLCSGLDCSCFSRFRWAYVFRFSLLGGGAVRACGYVGFLLQLFVGFALTAIGSIVLVDNGVG